MYNVFLKFRLLPCFITEDCYSLKEEDSFFILFHLHLLIKYSLIIIEIVNIQYTIHSFPGSKVGTINK